MAETEKKIERKILTITQLKEVERVGERQIEKLSFKAKAEADKELWYFTFRTSLFDVIKEGATINADVEISSREYEGNTYTDRRVVQIYVDGQPLGAKGRGSSWGGKSPQEIASIESQVAAKLIIELRIAGIIEDEHDLYKQVLGWCSGKLKSAAETKPIKPSPQEARLAGTPQQDGIPEIKNLGDLFRECYKRWKMNQSTVLKELNCSKEDITDPMGAFLQIKVVRED